MFIGCQASISFLTFSIVLLLRGHCFFIIDSLIMNISIFRSIGSVNILTHTDCT